MRASAYFGVSAKGRALMLELYRLWGEQKLEPMPAEVDGRVLAGLLRKQMVTTRQDDNGMHRVQLTWDRGWPFACGLAAAELDR